MSYLCQKCQKLGVTDFVSEIKRGKNYPDFEKLAHVIQHGLKEFIGKYITGESTKANVLSHILQKCVKKTPNAPKYSTKTPLLPRHLMDTLYQIETNDDFYRLQFIHRTLTVSPFMSGQSSTVFLAIKVVLRPKTTKKIILFFFGFQNYVN